MEATTRDEAARPKALRLRLLGPLALVRAGQPVALPASRKLRALLAYLALAPRPVGRSQLCELLWDDPGDPRGELRWCLSRIRSAVDEPGCKRVVTLDDTVRLDLADVGVDALDVAIAANAGVGTLPPANLRALAALFEGDFLEGLEIERAPVFGGWMTAQRRRLRGCHAALLEQLATRLPDDEALVYLEKWVQLAPFDRRVHERLLAALARNARLREGEEHLAATLAMFEAEGLDGAPLRAAWRDARAQPVAGEPGLVLPGAADIVLPGPTAATGNATTAANGDAATAARRASIAVMPFTDASAQPGARGGVADALAHDITARLARLRSLFVIAQGSAFALHERRIGPEEAGRMLNVDYMVGGSLRVQGQRFSVSVELVETRSARVVWSEVLNPKLDDALLVLEEIGNRIVASIAAEIENLERNRAILRPPNSLDAWEAHHRGLWHMYRFTRDDNERARQFFAMAVRLDPTYARAYAGLSFTHFQNVFLGWGERAAETDRAWAAAGQSLMADDRDPAAHWAMGRALWLRGATGEALQELERSVDLSPNFALAHYTLAFVQAQAGDPAAAIVAADCSRNLSPFDPLLFAMLGSRAMALARQGHFEDAASFAVKAAGRPNAHAHIHAIAACCLGLAGSIDEARRYVAAIHREMPHYGVADFLEAFRFAPDAAALFTRGARRAGLA